MVSCSVYKFLFLKYCISKSFFNGLTNIFTVCCLSSFALSQEASQAGVVQEKLFEMDEKVPEYEDVV